MNYKIFQICFKKEQIDEVDSLLTPFDNIKNEQPQLREYHSFDRIITEGYVDDLDAWGVFGPRWNEKLKYSSKEIFDSINDNPDHDVYIFNFARIVCAYHYNVWDQGECHHKGIVPVSRHILKNIMGTDFAINELMTDKTMCYSSYFVGTKKFWNEYMTFLRQVKYELDHLPKNLNIVFNSSANYSRDKSLNLFPFIIERMFSTYLHIRNDLKIYSKPYDYSLYKYIPVGYHKLIKALNDIKKQQTINEWLAFRTYFFFKYSHFLDFD
jgi:hypothetical protein